MVLQVVALCAAHVPVPEQARGHHPSALYPVRAAAPTVPAVPAELFRPWPVPPQPCVLHPCLRASCVCSSPAEQADPKLYAANVRELMGSHLGVPLVGALGGAGGVYCKQDLGGGALCAWLPSHQACQQAGAWPCQMWGHCMGAAVAGGARQQA